MRFAPTVITGRPINDGGMFYIMIGNLNANHFLIPAFTTYNNIQIPFAYPPLSFYLGGLISLMGISTLDILRWLPPIISTLTLPAFYWMASIILGSRTKSALATLAYALVPRSFSWYVMGGGLSRSLGVFFLLLTCGSAWAMFTKPSWRYLSQTALFSAGAILSHPEAGLHAAASCALMWLFKGRSKRTLLYGAATALGTILIASPWWATVLIQHGLTPFQSAMNTGGHGALLGIWRTVPDITEERFFPLFAVLGLLGLAIQAMRHDWFLPVWLLVPFIVDPRSAAAIAIIPLAILAGVGLSDFIILSITKHRSPTDEAQTDWTFLMSQSVAVRIFLGFVMLFGLVGSFSYDFSLANYVVSPAAQQAMLWAKNNTPSGGQFVVLTGRPDPFSDPSVEWFPAISLRTSVNTIQGREWLLGKNFLSSLNNMEALQTCVNDRLDCVTKWTEANQFTFDYIYIEKSKYDTAPGPLVNQLLNSPDYMLVFENAGAVIFERK